MKAGLAQLAGDHMYEAAQTAPLDRRGIFEFLFSVFRWALLCKFQQNTRFLFFAF